MLFDIRTPDLAYDFLEAFLGISFTDFIKEYIVECDNDFDSFWERWADRIKLINIDDWGFVVIHVTSNNDNCLEIKTNGIRNLQSVLTGDTVIRNKLLQNGFTFDIENNTLNIDAQTFNIDYSEYCGRYDLTKFEKKLERVSHKIYYDYQINGFFAHSDVTKYGTNIHKRPEFLYNLGNAFPQAIALENEWIKESKGYLVTFHAKLCQFAWFTFYNEKQNYYDDLIDKQNLKKWILSQAINRSLDRSDSPSQIFAYMDATTVISPEQIVGINEIL